MLLLLFYWLKKYEKIIDLDPRPSILDPASLLSTPPLNMEPSTLKPRRKDGISRLSLFCYCWCYLLKLPRITYANKGSSSFCSRIVSHWSKEINTQSTPKIARVVRDVSGETIFSFRFTTHASRFHEPGAFRAHMFFLRCKSIALSYTQHFGYLLLNHS